MLVLVDSTRFTGHISTVLLITKLHCTAMDTEFCGQCYWAQQMILYDIFWAFKLAAIGENWMGYSHIFSVCRELNNSDILARVINVNPQKLWYLNSQLVVVVVFVFLWLCNLCLCVFECLILFFMYLCDCVSVCLCLCEILDASKNMTKKSNPSCHHHQLEA